MVEVSLNEIVQEQINRRKRIVETVFRNYLDKLDSLRGKIAELRSQIASFSEESFPDLKSRLRMIGDLIDKGAEEEISSIRGRLERIKTRFDKDTINIGVVGPARSGKSTLIQVISGLDSKSVPTSELGFCTGARSIIKHTNGEPYAEVYFHTKKSFMDEVVLEHLRELEKVACEKGEGIGFPVTIETFEEFEKLKLPDINSLQGNVLIKRLQEMLDNIEYYRKLLDSPPRRIEIDEVADYVARPENKPRLHYAVRKAVIYANLATEVENVAFIDLPGLDEYAPGARERFLEAIKNEIDLLLFVRFPKPHGDDLRVEDIGILNDVDRIFRSVGLPLSKGLFIVLNKDISGSNELQVNDMKNKIRDQFKGVEVIEVICRDPQSVRENIVDRIKGYLQSEVSKIDETILEETENKINGFFAKFVKDLDKAIKEVDKLIPRVDDEERRKFDDKFERFYSDLKLSLMKLLNEYEWGLWDEKKAEDRKKEFVEELEKVCEKALGVKLPTVEDLEKMLYCGENIGSSVKELTNKYRTLLSGAFSEMDEYLSNKVSELKEQVNKCFKLLDPLRDGKRNQRILEIIRNKWLNDKEFPNLKRGIDLFLNYNPTYRSLFHHFVRDEFRNLNPRYAEVEIHKSLISLDKGNSEMSHREIAEIMVNWLENRGFKETLYRVKKKLEEECADLLYKLNLSVLEELVDNLLWKEGVDKEWKSLVYRLRGKLWPDEFQCTERRYEIYSELKSRLMEIRNFLSRVGGDGNA